MPHSPGVDATAQWVALRRAGFQCAAAQLPHLRDAYARIQALRLALCPVDLWRYVEFGAVLAAYRGEKRVLDVGSPRLLARYLAREHGAALIACDLSPTITGERRVYGRGLSRGQFHGLRCDGARLPFAANAIDFAYCVSVIEHIACDGDQHTLRELARVLAPGARCVVTVPCAPSHEEIWLDQDIFGAQQRREDGKVFFCRLYDWSSARERLTVVEGLRVVSARAWQVRDRRGFEGYQRRTVRPRSAGSILEKMRDFRHAKHFLEPCTAFEKPIQTRGVLVLTYERES